MKPAVGKIALFILLLTGISTVAKEQPGRTEVIAGAGGQKIVKHFRTSGTLDTIERYSPAGDLIGVLHHDSKGHPTQADMFDGKALAARIYYRSNGQPRSVERYNAAGVTRSVEELDENGARSSYREFDDAGKLVPAPGN